jgi:hypothetical protein
VRRHAEKPIKLVQLRVCRLCYNGELSNKNKTGYGILYFKNKDKFMGAFLDDQASGHGTYYDNHLRWRVMGVWANN